MDGMRSFSPIAPRANSRRKVIAEDIVLHQAAGFLRCNITIYYRRDTGLGYDYHRLGIAVAHASHFDYAYTVLILAQLVLIACSTSNAPAALPQVAVLTMMTGFLPSQSSCQRDSAWLFIL